jgi:hypothetical protein
MKKRLVIGKDTLIEVEINGTTHIISENYSYKTETYYTILKHELDGLLIKPSSRSILDAYVVPICLERAKLAGLPVCEWGISHWNVPAPAIIYGMNYFSKNTEHFIIYDSVKAEGIVKHLTNSWKYPFCYQKLESGATLHSCIVVFGDVTDERSPVLALSKKVYDVFGLPLVKIMFVKSGDRYTLSSLTPTKYSELSHEDIERLQFYIQKGSV